MLTIDDLLELGFKPVEESNRFDFYANMKVIDYFYFEDGDEPTSKNETYDEFKEDEIEKLILEAYEKSDKSIKGGTYFGFLKISYVPGSHSFWFSIYEDDSGYVLLDQSESEYLYNNVISKEKELCLIEGHHIHYEYDEEVYELLAEKTRRMASKSKDEDTASYLEEKADSFEDCIRTQSCWSDSDTDEKQKRIIGSKDGYLLLCNLYESVEYEESYRYVDYSSFGPVCILELGPKVKEILHKIKD